MINNAVIAPLLNPAVALTAQFDAWGGITIGAKIGTLLTTGPDAGKYDYPAKASALGSALDASNASVHFEFSVDPGDPKAVGYPQSGLLIERDDDWNYPWDDEVDRVIGGQAYPAGTGPLSAAGNSRMGVLPRNYLKGVFSGPVGDDPQGHPGSQFVILGICRSSASVILEATPVKYMTLWLPPGAVGTLRLTKIKSAGSDNPGEVTKAVFTTTSAAEAFAQGKLIEFPTFRLPTLKQK